jgi:hypothetical protein
MTSNEWGGVVIAVVVILLLVVVFWPVGPDGSAGDEEPLPMPAPTRPSLPPFCAVPAQREPTEPPPLAYPVPGQQADTEWLPMSPDSRAAEADFLRNLFDSSPNAEDVRTDLRADPGPQDPA